MLQRPSQLHKQREQLELCPAATGILETHGICSLTWPIGSAIAMYGFVLGKRIIFPLNRIESACWSCSGQWKPASLCFVWAATHSPASTITPDDLGVGCPGCSSPAVPPITYWLILCLTIIVRGEREQVDLRAMPSCSLFSSWMAEEVWLSTQESAVCKNYELQ